MGKIINNQITSSFSGSFGHQIVFRRIGNQTFFAKKAGSSSLPPTSTQTGNRRLFAEAQHYASNVRENPNLNEWYCIMAKVNGLRNAQLAAVKDYRAKPEIETINTKGYKGNIGDVIHIKPKMLLKIEKMEITIYASDGSVLESGLAVKADLNWKHHATVFNPKVEASRVDIVAYDRFGKSCRVANYLNA